MSFNRVAETGIVIGCSKTKRSGGVHNNSFSSSLKEGLSDAAFQHLMESRRQLAQMLNFEPGRDLGFASTGAPLRFLPAFKRYNGKIYQRAEVTNFYPRANGCRLVIVSALYGLLDADDLIRDYDLQMGDMLPVGTRVGTWWKQRRLGAILQEYVKSIQPAVVHDLLSNEYREALKPFAGARLHGAVKVHSYPGMGSGSIWRRGDDLRRLLSQHE